MIHIVKFCMYYSACIARCVHYTWCVCARVRIVFGSHTVSVCVLHSARGMSWYARVGGCAVRGTCILCVAYGVVCVLCELGSLLVM